MNKLRDIFGYILGLMLFVGLMPVLMWILFFAIMFIQVLSEERRLRRDFGKEYDEYCKNVPRYIPRLTPWKPKSNRYG